MFYDLHLPVRRGNPPDRRKLVLQELRRYGYGTVANVVEVRGTLKLEKQKIGAMESVFTNEEKGETSLKGRFNTLGDTKSIRQLRRISVVCESTEDAKRLLTPSSHVRENHFQGCAHSCFRLKPSSYLSIIYRF